MIPGACSFVFSAYAALLAGEQKQNQPTKLSADVWIMKMWDIYTLGFYSAVKKNKFAHKWMELKNNVQNKVIKAQKDKCLR